LDATGNWSDFREGPGGGTLLQVRTANTVNEYTAITGTTTWTTPAYDDAGNTTSFPQPNNLSSAYTATYDAWNRMTAVQASSVNVATYAYDGRNRRITQNTYSGGTLTETREFYFTSNWQDIEEQVSGSMVDQYVYGIRYIDELVCRDDSSANRYYVMQDANFNVTSICDKSSGAVDERYRYQPYGQQTVFDSSWTVLSGSAYDWVVGFQGLESDVATGLVYVRNRWLHAELGRWAQREPSRAKVIDGIYQYVRSNPVNRVDPQGLQAFELNRKLGAGPNEKDVVRSNYNCFSHTFVYTADSVTEDVFDPTTGQDMGTIKHWVLRHTYSWGNAAGLTTWHQDQPEDVNAAWQAINSGYMGEQWGPDDPKFDIAVDAAFRDMKISAGEEHWNLIICNNCKDAAGDLEDDAGTIWVLEMQQGKAPPGPHP
jgi:RHS repeat-associated protein